MAKTVLITGASSGIGEAAVAAFASRGWNVAATMRTVPPTNPFASFATVTCYPLDVTSGESIRHAFRSVIEQHGRINVVVNNAGYGVEGIFEGMSDEVIEKQFDTNVFGLMRVTREAIHHMRGQGGGTIIQVASMGGRLTFPLYSIYHGTKWAVEGFSESLHYELLPFNIRIKLIEPGIVRTQFTGRSKISVGATFTTDYDSHLDKIRKQTIELGKRAVAPEKIARGILKAATDKSNRMRYPVGYPAPSLLRLRRYIPDSWYFGLIKKMFKVSF